MNVAANDLSVVVFRQLGTDFDLPGDPPGVLANTGELAKIVFELNDIETDAIALSVDGAINWKGDAVINPVTDELLVASVSGAPLSLKTLAAMDRPARKAWGVRRSKLGGGNGPTMTQVPMLADFELLSVKPSAQWIAQGESISLAVNLRNNGQPWTELQPLELAAYWDGPAGLGLLASAIDISALSPGEATEFQLTIMAQDSFNVDDLHDLHVVVNPGGALAEADGGNNTQVVTLGALPVPQNLTLTADQASGVIIVHWDAVTDSRVTGYRAYRVNPDQSVLSVGASNVAGFADFSAGGGQVYEYYVTSHSARLMESAPSERVTGVTQDEVRLFRNSFEESP